MPSYRVTVDIGDVREGVAPADVLPAAERILAKTHQVEERHLDVAQVGPGVLQPRIQLRFVVDPGERATEDAEAGAVVRLLVEELGASARCGRWELRRGPGRRWAVVATGAAEGFREP